MPSPYKINNEEINSEDSPELLDHSAQKEVTDPLARKESIDKVYQKIENPEFATNFPNSKKILNQLKNKEIFYDISSKVLDKLTRADNYWVDLWQIVFDKHALEVFSKILENSNYNDLFFNKEYSVIKNSIIYEYETKLKEKEIEDIKEEREDNKEEREDTKKSIEKNIIEIDWLYSKTIDNKFKPTDDSEQSLELENTKQEVLATDPKIKEKLKEGWIPFFKYLKYWFTAKKLTENNDEPTPWKSEFIRSFNELNQSLGIDIQFAYFEDEKNKNKVRLFRQKNTSLS